MSEYFTYIILTSNGKYYVGHTNNLENRVDYHTKGLGANFTAQNKPIRLTWSQKFSTEIEAIKREHQIKGWSRSKKERLIAGTWK